jgi:hypothetical protein
MATLGSARNYAISATTRAPKMAEMHPIKNKYPTPPPQKHSFGRADVAQLSPNQQFANPPCVPISKQRPSRQACFGAKYASKRGKTVVF